MKLISLNTWAGRAGKEKLLDFLKHHEDVDIFCFQEIWEGGHEYAKRWNGLHTTLLTDIGAVLREHRSFFRPHYMDWWGIAMFIKKDLDIMNEGELFVYKDRGYADKNEEANHARNLQYATITTPRGLCTVMNLHGAWIANSKKKDTESRLLQSDNVVRFAKGLKNPYVFCGDLNLDPVSESIKKFEDAGMRNLIKGYGITSTRSSHYKKPLRFADYTLVSPGINVVDFKVLPDEVSDHLAMYLEFE
ncbi:MAG TPA: endonuclease/exonuclease/phosphatase family protein [Candidatus Paceibacterota bacterium]|jgi:endonuclease/exonuclease/phosphatase family metal-dependent hydrolase|nr:endonuclease/exonuclease/phosphatase family protein [Candidatus Paceibacterota bacterium]